MRIINSFEVLGIMSGTSLDGVDLALCQLKQSEHGWAFQIKQAETISYSSEWLSKLESLPLGTAENLGEANAVYGKFLGELAITFCKSHNAQPDFIASHGHTVFHQPPHFTCQLGNGAYIAAASQTPVVSDFRTGNVALGGQGAPLVPIGDQLLFADMDACLNLGGFSNISFSKLDQRVAYDIGPANIVLNELAQSLGYPFDTNGQLARDGKLHQQLLDQLNALDYYQLEPPKSLGREWVETTFNPLLKKWQMSAHDQLHTCTVHFAQQIANSLNAHSIQRVLVTGGGAYNSFLIDCVQGQTSAELIVPEDVLINFKEALIFALLGALRWTNQINCLASVTGASKDHCSGAIYLP